MKAAIKKIGERLAAIEARLELGRPENGARRAIRRSFDEVLGLVFRRTGSPQLAIRAAVQHAADVARAVVAAKPAPPSLTAGGLLTAGGAAELDRILDRAWGNPARLYTVASIPGTDGRKQAVVGRNDVRIGSEYLAARRAARVAHA